MFRSWIALLGVAAGAQCAMAAFISVGGDRSWQQKSAFFVEDTYTVTYTTGSPLLKITKIDVTVGSGTTTTVFTDPLPLIGPGHLTGGFNLPLSGSAGPNGTITDALWDGDGFGSVSFAPGWFLGQDLVFVVDTDHDGPGGCNFDLLCELDRDFVTGTEFNAYGGMSFTLHFAVTNPGLSIRGPNTVTVPNGGWTTISDSILPWDNAVAGNWAGRIEVVPEPGSFVLMGGGLMALVLSRRRLRR